MKLACFESNKNTDEQNGSFIQALKIILARIKKVQLMYIPRITYLIIIALSLLIEVNGQSVDQENQINLGFFTQPEQEISGAITTVLGEELEKSPVSNLSQTFAGRFSGLISMETNGQPANSNVLTYIRGQSTINGQTPLFILDGVICSLKSIEFITPDEIESVSILKDASLTSIYGIWGGNGAIIINTKRGIMEKLKVTATIDQSFQQMTREPRFINSWEYATLQNEAWKNDGVTGNPPYSEKEIEAYKNGTDRDLFPNTNFYKLMFKPWAMMQRAGISTSAGNQFIKMFSNINFLHQGGQFIHDQSTFKPGEKIYDPKAGNNYQVNFRSNLDFKINSYLGGFIRLNGNVSRENVAGNTINQVVENSNSMIYSGLFYLPSTLYGPYTPIIADPDNPYKVSGGEVITNEYVDNPSYGLLNRFGFGKYTGTNIMAQTGLNTDLRFLLKGLTFGGRFAYETNSSGYHHIGAQFERWVRDNNPDVLGFTRIGEGTWDNKPLDYRARPGGTGYKLTLFSYRMNASVQLDYKNKFGDHEVSSMAYGYYQNYISDRTDGIYGFPYNRIFAGITAAWAFKNKYFMKADAAYSGSDQFSRGQRFTFTPSLSVGWILSKEDILSNVDWLNLLKIRASHGVTGNDNIGEGRFLYSDHFINGGAPLYIASLGYTITEYMNGNKSLTAEKIIKQNYGVDIRIMNDIMISIDYFRSWLNNMAANPIGLIPSFSGFKDGIIAPINAGVMKNHGIDLSLQYMRKIHPDWSVLIQGNLLWHKNEVIKAMELPMGADYAYQHRIEGYSYGQPFGYKIDYSKGPYFTSQEELKQVSYSFGTPRLGDFQYLNLNGDKTPDGKDIIDEKDMAPVGYPAVPRVGYGVSFGTNYKAFELVCLIQGTGLSSRQFHNSVGIDESLRGGIFSDIHLNAWTPERSEAESTITFPALSLQNSVSKQPNDFFTMRTSYVRIKCIELAYSLPESILKLMRSNEIRIALSAQNLFTWDFLQTTTIDPEVASLDAFQNYRVFNFGIKITF